jgi:replicative DNA helicase
MPDYEGQLISKVAQNGGINDLISQGIEDRHFADETNRKVWKFLSKHTRTYKESPSFEVIKEEFPNYEWDLVSEPTEFVRDRFITAVKRREAIEAFNDLAEILDENKYEEVSRIDELFLDKAKDLAQIVPSANISRFSSMPQRIQTYRLRKESGIKPGISFGIPRLDELTLGLQPHEYVTIAGWTGVGKTTLALVFAINHYVEGYTPMIVSLEMGEEELHRKLDAIAVGLKQHAMKEMTLSPNDMKKWEEYADKVDRVTNDIIIIDVDFATPEKVYAEIARWKPDVTIVDYVQLLQAPNYMRTSWEKIGYTSQMLKAAARQLKVPVYGLAQTNADSADDGARLTNMAGSKDIGKHSDIVLALNQTEEMKSLKKLEIRVEKNRGGPKDNIDMYWDQRSATFRQWTTTDAYGHVEVE